MIPITIDIGTDELIPKRPFVSVESLTALTTEPFKTYNPPFLSTNPVPPSPSTAALGIRKYVKQLWQMFLPMPIMGYVFPETRFVRYSALCEFSKVNSSIGIWCIFLSSNLHEIGERRFVMTVQSAMSVSHPSMSLTSRTETLPIAYFRLSSSSGRRRLMTKQVVPQLLWKRCFAVSTALPFSWSNMVPLPAKRPSCFS